MRSQKRSMGYRAFSLLLALALLVGVLWVPASAGGGEELIDSGDFIYSIGIYINQDGAEIQYARIVSVDESVHGSVTIPANLGGYPVMEISDYAFWGCALISDILVERDNAYFTSIDGMLFSKDGSELICCPEGKTGAVVIPNGVAEIGGSGFRNCISLTNVMIPWGVTAIGDGAFEGCTLLKSFVIQSRNAEIGSVAIGYEQVPYDEERLMPRGGEAEYQKIDGVQIFCYPDSTAQQYAQENEFKYQFIIPGDLDGDKEITTADARLALRAAGQLETLTPQQQAAADVDYDGEVTPADARMLLRAAAGLDASLALPPMADLPDPDPDPDPDPILPQGMAEIISFYKSAARNTTNANFKQTLTLNTLNLLGSGPLQALEAPLRTSLQNTLENNSGVKTGVPGDYQRLLPSEVASADAKLVDESIEITLHLKNFTANGNLDNPIEHAVEIPEKLVETAIDNMNGPFQVSYTSVSYRYAKASLSVRVNRETNQIESGTWNCEISFWANGVKVMSSECDCYGTIQNTIVMPA